MPSSGNRSTSDPSAGQRDDPALFLHRLDRLVRYLLSGRYGSANRVWKLQLDLLALQQDVQAQISELKSRDRDLESHQRLQELRQVRGQSRRFGDAVARLLLHLDRQKIIPLADNDPVRIPDRVTDEHSLRGTLAFAETMANEGWGFPLLHDITDCLRIGDITFIRTDGDLTVELKTRHHNEVRDDKTVTHSYELAAVAAQPLPGFASASTALADTDDAASRQGRREDRRTPRQVDRLIKVKARQDAGPDHLREIKGEPPMLSRTIDSTGLDRWDVLQRIARRARRSGYASEVVEDSFVFAAMYHPDGLTSERMGEFHRLPSDIATSGILHAEHGDWNAIWLNAVPDEPERSARLYLPYFLYPLPRATILDLLHGRMILLHISNPAQIAAALSRSGFAVRPTRGGDYRSGFDICAEITVSDGAPLTVALGSLAMPMREMIMEFHSVEFIVRVADEMVEGAKFGIEAQRSTKRPAS